VAYQLIIVGGGRIGAALAQGLRRSGFCAPGELAVIEVAAERRAELAESLAGTDVLASLELAHVGPATGVVLCVKPDQAEGAARTIGACGATRMLSIVAGVSSARLEAVMPAPVAVVRAMPNTPVLVDRGASAIAGGAHVTKADLDWAAEVLGSLGVVVRLAERHLDAVTGLSGSMPAYLYLVVEALIEAGVHQGLTREVARELVVATFAGSAALLEQTGASPEELRSQVTSPGGTTAAGIRMLEGRAVRAAFLEAVAAATERSRQLGR
jgi:pyrroline-5-carboxylate reductase